MSTTQNKIDLLTRTIELLTGAVAWISTVPADEATYVCHGLKAEARKHYVDGWITTNYREALENATEVFRATAVTMFGFAHRDVPWFWSKGSCGRSDAQLLALRAARLYVLEVCIIDLTGELGELKDKA